MLKEPEFLQVPFGKVQPWGKNPRNIKTEDLKKLAKSIQAKGQFQVLTCWKNGSGYETGGGNMRWQAMKNVLKYPDDKLIWISLNYPKGEAEKIELSLLDNMRFGEYDEQALAELAYPHIEEINLDDYKLDIGKAISLKDLIDDYAPDADGEDEVPEIDDSPAVTKMGDLFTLGKHRLLCGDATKEEEVKRLMGEKKADMVFTDPPYGIDYKYVNYDDSSQEKNLILIKKAFSLSPDSRVWTCGLMNLARDLEWNKDAKILCWHKKFAAAGNGLGGASTWEPVLAVKIKKGTLPNDHFEYSTDRERGLREKHSCPKPVGLFVYLIKHLAMGIIYDPFLGSGTTLIACEKLNRRCFGMEIEPKYCDVIITRYSNFTDIQEEEIRATRENG